jgi:Stress responsive A/B Barrel Domain
MTVRHLVLFRWKEGTTADVVAAIDAELDALPALIPALGSYVHGPDLGLGEGRWDFGIVAECDDAAGWAAYDQHPAHQRVVVEVIRPHVAERAAVQIGSAD